MVGIRGSRGWAYAGVLSAAFLVPIMHLAAVDLEGKTASKTAYLGHVDDRYLSVALAGGVGLILTALLVVYLAGLRQIAVVRRPLLADASIAIGGLAVMGLAVGFASSVIAAYGAHENYPFAPVRSLGMLAENFPVVLMPGLAGPAVLISVLALRDGSCHVSWAMSRPSSRWCSRCSVLCSQAWVPFPPWRGCYLAPWLCR